MNKLEIILTLIALTLIALFIAKKLEHSNKISFANSQNQSRLFRNNSEKELLRFESAVLTTIF